MVEGCKVCWSNARSKNFTIDFTRDLDERQLLGRIGNLL